MPEPYYQDDACMIYHGDCREILPLLAPVELAITSPPYYNARAYANWPSYSDYLRFMEEVLETLRCVVSPGRMLCLNSSSVIEARPSRNGRSRRYNIPADLHHLATKAGCWFQEEIVWVKPEGAAVNRNQRFSLDRHPLQWRANACTERISVYQVPTDGLNDHIIRGYGGRDRILGDYERSEVWQLTPAPSKAHPAPFPLAIPERLIRYYSWTGDIVLDPFMGSGTTLLAAQRCGRRAIGIEIEERYCEIAAKRLAQEVLPLEA